MEKKIENIVKHAEVSEKMIERYLCDRAKSLGGVCLKYSNANVAGYPDRLVILPGGCLVWVELKSKGRTRTRLQEIRCGQLESLGQRVFVADSKERIDEILAAL